MVRALSALNLGGTDTDKAPLTEISICTSLTYFQDGSATAQPS
jgi:hypothetical protein